MMKKFFTFGSSSNSESIQVPLVVDKKVNLDNTSNYGLEGQVCIKVPKSFQSSDKVFSNIENPSYENDNSATNSRLRRSLSFSSVAASNDNNEGVDQIKPYCFSNQNLSPSNSFNNVLQQPNSSSCRRSLTPAKKAKPNETSAAEHLHRIENRRLYKAHNGSPQNSSSSSVLDLYIDGEHQQEISKSKNISSKRNHTPNGGGKGRPPRIQYRESESPMKDLNGRQRSHSFRDLRRGQFYSSFYDHDSPIMIEDIYEAYASEESLGFQKQDLLSARNLYSVDNQDDALDELQRKFKEAKERVFVLSEEFEQERFLQETGLHVSSLIQKIRFLAEDRINMAIEVSSALQEQINDRAFAKENLKKANADFSSEILKAENEKIDLQSSLENELDRRSSEWSSKLEKYQSEEHRLMDRVRELAEQNVSLQREVSFLNDKVADSSSIIKRSELGLMDLTSKLEDSNHEKLNLQQNVSCLQEKYLAAESELGCLRKNSIDMENESQSLQNVATGLLRTCTQQERTICGLREILDKDIQSQSKERDGKHVEKLQIEHLRLTGVEHKLRREVESQRSEIDSLRNENINLLDRLKLCEKGSGFSTFKLDQEMCNRVCCLEKQGLSLLNESTRLCSKLLDFSKRKSGHLEGNGMSGLDKQFVRDSDVKVKGFLRGTENLTRNLKNMSVFLDEKSNIGVHLESGLGDNLHSEEMSMLELKVQTQSLLTSLLSDKYFSQEMELKQIKAELAAAISGNDNLKCEIQNATDDLIAATHKWKNLELEMAEKRRVVDELVEASNELAITKGKLSRISTERDEFWEELKRLKEEKMILKKRVEFLEEDVLRKEGEFSILKDSLADKEFNFLPSP